MWPVTLKMKHIKEVDGFQLCSHCNTLAFETVLMNVDCVACCILLDSQELNITLECSDFQELIKKSFFCAEGIFNVS